MLLNLPSLILKLDQSLAVFQPQKQKFLVTCLDMCCCFMANLHTVVLKFAPAKIQTNKAKTLPHFLGDNKFFFSHKLPPVPIKQPPDRPMRSTYRGKVLTLTQRIKTLGLIKGCKVFQHRRRQRAVSEELKLGKADFAPFLGRHEQFVYRVTGLPEFLPSR